MRLKPTVGLFVAAASLPAMQPASLTARQLFYTEDAPSSVWAITVTAVPFPCRFARRTSSFCPGG